MQFKLCLKFMQPGFVTLVIDFIENILLQFKMKCNPCTSIILVHIAYRPNPNFDMDDVDFFFIIEYHFYINDDHKHDSYFVQHWLQKH